MISVKTFFTKLKYVKLSDLFAFVKFAVAFPISKVVKKRWVNLWVICEDGACACDNGYAFFKFLIEKHPEQSVIYAIKKREKDFKKVEQLGKTVEYGSLLHWVYYLAATQNISSQKSGKPNAAVCYLLEVGGFLNNSRVFLQHGITINDSKWIYYNETKLSLFVCGAKPEYDFVKDRFQYPDGYVQYLGFPRFDDLHNIKSDEHMIIIMPTWRNWLTQKQKSIYSAMPNFKDSEYFIRWNSLLNNIEFLELLDKYELKVIFCPHRNVQEHMECFWSGSSRITIAKQNEYDIQELLKMASFMITDYSSVFFDFVYMKKPVLFYQFDNEMYRKKQLQEGYFDYSNNPFGENCNSENMLVEKIRKIIETKFALNSYFLAAHKEYFPLYDRNNGERVYQAIKRLDQGDK